MELFERCQRINDHLREGNEAGARDALIVLLDEMQTAEVPPTPLVNHLIREVGLFPYMQASTAAWYDRFAVEAFTADVGEPQPVALHREQSRLLHALLQGKSIAVSAPTSFGKSFVVDAFIAARHPNIVVILVPTIALTDETRRRLERRFGRRYKIITAADQPLADKSILVFPQERAQGYLRALKSVDMLIVDEFYKASKSFDKDRAASLIYVMQRLSRISKQRYFLAPNIDYLRESPLTEGMEFLRMDFNTVFLKKTELYDDIGKNEEKKSAALLSILESNPGKTLIYAGSYSNVSKVATLLLDARPQVPQPRLRQFASWLGRHYDPNWVLPRLISKGAGIHTGQLHRSLSQLQVRLFEEPDGLSQLISTSSIIEGVNTSAQNVVLWSNKAGQAKINNFTYKNIIGRGGRMLRHFVGKIFILEKPPPDEQTNLELDFPDELLGLEDRTWEDREYTPEQIARIEEYERTMASLIGEMNLRGLQNEGILQTTDGELALRIARAVVQDKRNWHVLSNLNSSDPTRWRNALFRLLKLTPAGWEARWNQFVRFVQVAAYNWERTIPEQLEELDEVDVGVWEFFKLERTMTFRLSALLSDVTTLYNQARPNDRLNLKPAIAKISHAFLPTVVFQLEEYGLPRMLSRKIQDAGVVDFEHGDLDLDSATARFLEIGLDAVADQLPDADPFDLYILKHFYDGLGDDVSWT